MNNYKYNDERFCSASFRRANATRSSFVGTNIQGADLRGANMVGADFDFSCWPLWAGSMDVTVDMRLVYQLLAHVAVLKCDDPEFTTIRELILPYAVKCHRAVELGLLTKEGKRNRGDNTVK